MMILVEITAGIFAMAVRERDVMGNSHKVSRKFLPLHVAEFQLRYNNRHNADIFGEAIWGC